MVAQPTIGMGGMLGEPFGLVAGFSNRFCNLCRVWAFFPHQVFHGLILQPDLGGLGPPFFLPA
jgi:hypothetical protein